MHLFNQCLIAHGSTAGQPSTERSEAPQRPSGDKSKMKPKKIFFISKDNKKKFELKIFKFVIREQLTLHSSPTEKDIIPSFFSAKQTKGTIFNNVLQWNISN